ncbi:hypothetical protein BOX15_Mlig031508g1, partial [Macrostomum lignano]
LMDDIHRNALLKARCVLVSQLVADNKLWGLLLERKVFTKPMLERILCQGTPHERRQQLMDDLPRRGPDAFGQFLGILRDTRQQDLADYLDGMDRHLRHGHPLPSEPRPQPRPPSGPSQPAQPSQPQDDPSRRPSVDRSVSRIGVTNQPNIPDDVLSVQEVLERHEDGLEELNFHTCGIIDSTELMPQPVTQQHLTEKSKNDWEFTYQLRSNPKGLLLIISNRDFVKKSKRTGTEVDCENLTRVFKNLGYELYRNQVFNDKTAAEMKSLCRDFILDPRHESLDSCVLCILSHGDQGGVIYGRDDLPATEDELFEHFNSDRCRLHNKPKLVIIQACRGSMKDKGHIFDQTDSASGDKTDQTTVQKIIHSLQEENYSDTMDLEKRVPLYADIVFAHSTTPGFVSWRHELRGSWFIQTIAKTFAAYAHEEHVFDMLTTVNRIVTETFGGRLGYVSMPHPISRLRKKFYFFPK